MVAYTSRAAEDVLGERARQIAEEGWTLEHDDEHEDGSMADAAACYAATTDALKSVDYELPSGARVSRMRTLWPESWKWGWFKKVDRRRDLVKAGALIIAEIERLDRAADKEKELDGRR